MNQKINYPNNIKYQNNINNSYQNNINNPYQNNINNSYPNNISNSYPNANNPNQIKNNIYQNNANNPNQNVKNPYKNNANNLQQSYLKQNSNENKSNYNPKENLLKYSLNDLINNKKYKIIKELGKGGYGKVNLILSNLDNKLYALKEVIIIKEGEDNINSIKNEIDIFSKFNCNNIVKYYDSYKDNNNFYILMEYCDGQN